MMQLEIVLRYDKLHRKVTNFGFNFSFVCKGHPRKIGFLRFKFVTRVIRKINKNKLTG